MRDTAGDLQHLHALCEHGRMNWSEPEHAWMAKPLDVVEALTHEGFSEYKREETRSRRDRPPTGGVWQGLNTETGAVASAIWVRRADDTDPMIFIDVDGEPFDGSPRRV